MTERKRTSKMTPEERALREAHQAEARARIAERREIERRMEDAARIAADNK